MSRVMTDEEAARWDPYSTSPSESKPTAPATSPVIINLADVVAEAVQWLWPGRIALGKVTLLAGDPGLGKSFITLDLATRVTLGSAWPDNRLTRAPQGGVVYLGCEDDLADTVRPRLDASGADISRVFAIQGIKGHDDAGAYERSVDLSRDLGAVEQAIEATRDPRLLIIDPISAYLGKTESHNNADVRAMLAPLSDLASRHRMAVVAVTHLNKGQGNALYRATGSLAFVAAARAAWLVVKDKDDDRRRLFLPMKNNLAADTSGMAYRITGEHTNGQPIVEWEPDAVTVTADDMLAVDRRAPGPSPEAVTDATEFLRDALAAGARLAREVYDEAGGHDISKRSIERAKDKLSVIAYRDKIPGPWLWRLPDSNTANNNASPKQLGDLGYLGGLVIPQQLTSCEREGESQHRQDTEAQGDGELFT